MKFILLLAAGLAAVSLASAQCDVPSVTTSSGSHARAGPYCSGDLIFEDNFDTFNHDVWQHESTLGGGGNWEFQWYTNNRSNSYTEDGTLYLRPTLTADAMGEEFIRSGVLNLHGGSPADECTNPAWWGCERQGSPTNVLNPVKSARVRSVNSINFKYGRIEVNARMPAGDWLWPAIWLLPKRNAYGTWPASGEIDLMESRGNLNLEQGGQNIGAEQMGSTLHYGPDPSLNGWPQAHFSRNTAPGQGWNNDFHRYQMTWTPTSIAFSVDDTPTGTVDVEDGFWNRGGFPDNRENPWRTGTPMAPFDEEFYLLINNAVGGTAYFPDDVENPGGKPWHNQSPAASTDFWDGRAQWLPTWNLDEDFSKSASVQVDYVRIWAL